MVGIAGTELTREEAALFGKYRFGGVILFQHNLRAPRQIYSLCRTLRERAPADKPPLLAVDQEGGRVHRLPAPFTRFPPAAVVGRAADPELAFAMGRATARELNAVGINVNFAPVLDVLSSRANPVIGDRALSSDPALVASLGWRIAEGLRSGGVIPCGKHFPGHGDTARDSHLELPVVARDARSLRALELPPFVHACARGIESLMTAHVVYPALDPDRPATLSRAIVTGLLRGELDYNGVVFTDDLEMSAISRYRDAGEAALAAVEAGADVLLFCHEIERALEAFDRLVDRAENDPGFESRVRESAARIANLKRRSLKAFPAEDAFAELDLAAHRRIAQAITEACRRCTR